MTSIDQYKKEILHEWQGNSAVDFCLKIIDYISALPVEQMQMLTFQSMTNAVGLKEVDDTILRAVSLLASTSIDALETKLLLIDDDEREFDIEKGELAEARKTGFLVHPATGEQIRDFETKIIPYFVPSERFLQIRND